MENINASYVKFRNDILSKIKNPCEKLHQITLWLVKNRKSIESINIGHVKHEKEKTDSKFKVINSFPIAFNEKEIYGKPYFKDEEYINYLSSLNGLETKLPQVNCEIDCVKYVLPDYDKNKHFLITMFDVYNYVMKRNPSGKDYYQLTYNIIKKSIYKINYILSDITKYLNDILSINQDLDKSDYWCSFEVIAKYKSGNKKDPKQFRPLIFTPLFVRILDGILALKIESVCLQSDKVLNSKIQRKMTRERSGLNETIYEVNNNIIESINKKSNR